MFIKFIFCKLFKFYKIIFYTDLKISQTYQKFQQKNKYFTEVVFKVNGAHSRNFRNFSSDLKIKIIFHEILENH